jgi:hypothetical protein
VGTDSSSPYSASWNTGSVANGTHSITSKAYDAAGNSATSEAVSVTVSNSSTDATPPSVAITRPSNGQWVLGASSVTITANATDNVGVTKVQFYANGALIGTDSIAPFGMVWGVSGKRGAFALTAKAYDAAGNATTSGTVNVRLY